MAKPIANPWLKNVRVTKPKGKVRLKITVPIEVIIPLDALLTVDRAGQRAEIAGLVLERLALDIKEELEPAIIERLEKSGI